ncbi:hypothetical protein D3C81_1359440 [compost metagenome]
MQPGVTVERSQIILSEFRGDQVHQRLTTAAVQLAHFTDMRGVVAFADKLCQRGLNQKVSAAIEVVMHFLQRCSERFGQHNIPESEGRIERFAECADVDNWTFFLQSLQ